LLIIYIRLSHNNNMPRLLPGSSVKSHFHEVYEKGVKRRKCNYCRTDYSFSTATDNLEKHLTLHPKAYNEFVAIKKNKASTFPSLYEAPPHHPYCSSPSDLSISYKNQGNQIPSRCYAIMGICW
jgi:BED zinc finger